MLTTSLILAQQYDYLSPRFQKAYAFLSRTDLAGLEPGNYPIDGEDVYANVQHYTTMPFGEAAFESHNNYFDIQFMVEGEERFGYIPRSELKVETLPYDTARDLTFYAEPVADRADYILLRQGDLAIVPPEDAHKPRCMAEEPRPVKKIVVKVRV